MCTRKEMSLLFCILIWLLRENCTPNKNWACLVGYLKIINTFLKNNMITLNKLSEKLKSGITSLVGQAIHE